MIKRDYLLQLIERAGPFLKRLFHLRQAGRPGEAEAALQEGLRELIGLDAQLVLTLSAADLRGLLGIDQGQAAGRCLAAAELLAEYAATLEARGEGDRAGAARSKAIDLFEWVASQPGGSAAVSASERYAACRGRERPPTSDPR